MKAHIYSFVSTLLFLVLLGAPAAQAVCNNKGLQWAYYNNTSGDNLSANYSNFDPTTYYKTAPIYKARTPRVGGVYAAGTGTAPISIYHSKTKFSPSYFVLNHQGYLHAHTTGTYTFSFQNVDDIFLLWVGQKAYNTWTRDNADCLAAFDYTVPVGGSCTYQFQANKGDFVPIRLMFGETGTPAEGQVTLTDPTGHIILSPTTKYGKNILRHGCGKGKHLAPKFPKFGNF